MLCPPVETGPWGSNRGLGMQDSDILEVFGWKDVTMLRRYVAAVADELAQDAHRRFSPGDALPNSR